MQLQVMGRERPTELVASILYDMECLERRRRPAAVQPDEWDEEVARCNAWP